MAPSLDRVDAGERVTFRRKGRVYAIVPVKDDNIISPSLQSKIDKARAAFREGRCVKLKSHEDIDAYFKGL